jgi:enamine deaminase RidA (YjgF/YER057c/UK114 family)
MAAKQTVFTKNAPPPIPVLSQGIIHNGIVYCSGQVGMDPATNQLVYGSVKDRTVS